MLTLIFDLYRIYSLLLLKVDGTPRPSGLLTVSRPGSANLTDVTEKLLEKSFEAIVAEIVKEAVGDERTAYVALVRRQSAGIATSFVTHKVDSIVRSVVTETVSRVVARTAARMAHESIAGAVTKGVSHVKDKVVAERIRVEQQEAAAAHRKAEELRKEKEELERKQAEQLRKDQEIAAKLNEEQLRKEQEQQANKLKAEQLRKEEEAKQKAQDPHTQKSKTEHQNQDKTSVQLKAEHPHKVHETETVRHTTSRKLVQNIISAVLKDLGALTEELDDASVASIVSTAEENSVLDMEQGAAETFVRKLLSDCMEVLKLKSVSHIAHVFVETFLGQTIHKVIERKKLQNLKENDVQHRKELEEKKGQVSKLNLQKDVDQPRQKQLDEGQKKQSDENRTKQEDLQKKQKEFKQQRGKSLRLQQHRLEGQQEQKKGAKSTKRTQADPQPANTDAEPQVGPVATRASTDDANTREGVASEHRQQHQHAESAALTLVVEVEHGHKQSELHSHAQSGRVSPSGGHHSPLMDVDATELISLPEPVELEVDEVAEAESAIKLQGQIQVGDNRTVVVPFYYVRALPLGCHNIFAYDC